MTCHNQLTLTHDDPNKIREVIDAYKEKRLLSYFCPEPDYCDDSVIERMIEAYRRGAYCDFLAVSESDVRDRTQYFWRCDNWGVEREVGLNEEDGSGFITDESDDILELSFVTPGNPPLAAYRAARITHGFDISSSYGQADNEFAGKYSYDGDGESRQSWILVDIKPQADGSFNCHYGYGHFKMRICKESRGDLKSLMFPVDAATTAPDAIQSDFSQRSHPRFNMLKTECGSEQESRHECCGQSQASSDARQIRRECGEGVISVTAC